MIKTTTKTSIQIKANPITILFLTLSLASCKTGERPDDEHNTPINHSDNVFASTQNWYVNKAWSELASADGGQAIAQHSTAVWLSSLSDIEPIAANGIPGLPIDEDNTQPRDGIGLRGHLTAAEAQGNALVQLVIYNLPGRDCAAVSSTGELPASARGMEIYQTNYIDRIANIISDFPHIPIVAVIEPDSLPNLVINSRDAPCQEVDNSNAHGYTNGVRYAINTLSELANVHIYLDIKASNSLGWDADLQMSTLFMHGVLTGFEPLTNLAQTLGDQIESKDGAFGRYTEIGDAFVPPSPPASGNVSPPGYNKIDGFISNVADYIPTREPYLGDPLLPEGPNPLNSAYFFDWNPRIDELTYTRDWLTEIRAIAKDKDNIDTNHLGMLIDTSRNGWGQRQLMLRDNPTVNQDPELANDYRIDGREHRQNWCNQPSGIGARPQAKPERHEPWLDAYVWVKPPGESDGPDTSLVFMPGSGISYKKGGIDPMCDPNELSTPGQQWESTIDLNLGTGAIPLGPLERDWFTDGFKILLDNAWPPLCEGENDVCPE